jgi:hypothetical protein
MRRALDKKSIFSERGGERERGVVTLGWNRRNLVPNK